MKPSHAVVLLVTCLVGGLVSIYMDYRQLTSLHPPRCHPSPHSPDELICRLDR